MLRTMRAVVAGVGALFLTAAVLVTPASAAEVTPNTCTGMAEVEYSPTVKSTPADTTATGSSDLTCVGDPDHAAGEIFLEGDGELSCLTGGVSAGSGHLTWADNTVSEYDYEITVGLRPLGEMVLTAEGEVTSGPYTGEPFTFVAAIVADDVLGCITGAGIGGGSGLITIVIGV